MAITRLNVEGFRSLKHIKWSPARLNVLIGPNGSGKSNVLRALRMLRSIANGALYHDMLSAGGMGAIVWDSRVAQIEWTAMFDKACVYSLILDQVGSGAEYVISSETLIVKATEILTRDGRNVSLRGKTRPIVRAEDVKESALRLFNHEEEVTSMVDRLRGIAVYHDLIVHEDAELRQAAIARRETRLAENGQNLVPVLHTLYSTDRNFRETVNTALRAAFGSEFEELAFPPAADQRVDLRLQWRSLRTQQSAANLSDGTLRFLLLVTILAAPSPGEVIAIDEPELGLHPNMLPIIAELAQQASEHTQVVFTTHSPQFLDAFSEPPATTVMTLENGESKLEMLSGKDLAAWLERYTLGELFRSGELEAIV